MSTAGRQQAPPRSPLGARLTVLGLVLAFLLMVGAVVRGAYFAHPDIRVAWVDAGLESQFAIGRVVPVPDQGVYVIGLENGQLRAVDGLVKRSGCLVQWLPEDERGRARNPRQQPGAYRDPCSGAVWAASGDALEGTREPLRTFELAPFTAPDGSRHVRVEVLGDRHPQAR